MIMCLFKEFILGSLLCAFTACSSDDSDGKIEKKPDDTTAMDTITYRALVYIDEPSLNLRYGGEKRFNQNLQTLFYNTTRFWNNSKNKFKYYFRFVPAGLKVYSHVDGQEYKEASQEAGGPLDPARYDYVVFFCLAAPSNTMSCGGSSDGHSVIWCTKTLETQKRDGDIFNDGVYPTKLGTYSNLGHEAGHFRGATDLYQYPIKAKNNPINGETYHPGPCNMGTGEWAWSDYASAVFNYTARYKRLPSDWSERRFPQSIEITVKNKDGQPVKDATVKLYGCRGGGGDKGLPSGDNGPDVYKEPFRTYSTDNNGKVVINNAYRLYQVEKNKENNLPDVLPWDYWFNFLVEATDQNNNKAYVWMPDLEIQRQHLDEDTQVYHTEIIYKH
jgi:hypothetical protein